MKDAARARLSAKLRALRAKTTASGCTEAEAMAAAELAAKLMAEHGLSAEEIEMTEAMVREATVSATWRSDLVGTIAYCTNTAVLLGIKIVGAEWIFVGRAPGPEIAVYLREICFRAVDRELTAFKASTFYRRRRSLATKRQAAADFRDALVRRLCRRLAELFGPTTSDDARADAQAVLDRRFPSSQSLTRPARDTRYSEAAAQGWLAAGNVPLNRGVNGTANLKAIEGGRG